MNLTNDNLSKKQIKKEKQQLQREQQARELFRTLKSTNDWIILDIEATGNKLNKQAEIIEIAIIDSRKKVLLNTLIKPKHPIPEESTLIHGITNEQVANAPTWKQIHKKASFILHSKKILSYNAYSEHRFLNQTYKTWGMNSPRLQIECVCNAYTYLTRSEQRVSLENAVGYEIKHRALNDCLAVWDLIKKVPL